MIFAEQGSMASLPRSWAEAFLMTFKGMSSLALLSSTSIPSAFNKHPWIDYFGGHLTTKAISLVQDVPRRSAILTQAGKREPLLFVLEVIRHGPDQQMFKLFKCLFDPAKAVFASNEIDRSIREMNAPLPGDYVERRFMIPETMSRIAG